MAVYWARETNAKKRDRANDVLDAQHCAMGTEERKKDGVGGGVKSKHIIASRHRLSPLLSIPLYLYTTLSRVSTECERDKDNTIQECELCSLENYMLNVHVRRVPHNGPGCLNAIFHSVLLLNHFGDGSVAVRRE